MLFRLPRVFWQQLSPCHGRPFKGRAVLSSAVVIAVLGPSFRRSCVVNRIHLTTKEGASWNGSMDGHGAQNAAHARDQFFSSTLSWRLLVSATPFLLFFRVSCKHKRHNGRSQRKWTPPHPLSDLPLRLFSPLLSLERALLFLPGVDKDLPLSFEQAKSCPLLSAPDRWCSLDC